MKESNNKNVILQLIPTHERRNQTRMWPGVYQAAKTLLFLPSKIWYRNVRSQ